MIENDKYLCKILVIAENHQTDANETGLIQEFVRDPNAIKNQILAKYDIPNIFYPKKRQKFELASSKLIRHHKSLPGKCLKLVNTEVIVWKRSQDHEYVILFLQNDDSIVSNEKLTYTVYLNVCKKSAKPCVPKKYPRLVRYRRNYRRYVTSSSGKKIAKRMIKNRLKLTENKKMHNVERKIEKLRVLDNTKNLNRCLQNSVETQTNYKEKYMTAILDVENVTRDDQFSKIIITRDVQTKQDVDKFVNIVKYTDSSIICDKFQYIRQGIKKNKMLVNDIKAIAFVSKKCIKMYVQNESKLLKEFPCNSVSKAIKMNGIQFISVQSMNFKLKNIKLSPTRRRAASKHIQKTNLSDVGVDVEQMDEECKREKIVPDSRHIEENLSFTASQMKTSDSPVNLVKNAQVPVPNAPILNGRFLSREANGKLESDTGATKSSTVENNDWKKFSNKCTNPVKMVISGENVLKHTCTGAKVNIKPVQVSRQPTIVNKDVVLSQIQDSLKLVTERLTKSTEILKQIVGKSNDILVKGFKDPLPAEEMALLRRNDSRNTCVKHNQRFSQLSLYARPTGPAACSSRTLEDTGHSSCKQNHYFHKMKYDKHLITVIPIKNFIVDNMRKVSSNAVREKKSGKRSKSAPSAKPILPVINSQYFCLKKPATALVSKSRTVGQHDKIKPVIQTVRETPLQIKTVRPVPRVLDTCKSLSKLTLNDLAPLQSEYPRKDHLTELCQEHSYQYADVAKYLEPMIQCASDNCKSCKSLADTDRLTPKRDGLSNKNIGMGKYAPVNSGFDFKRYISLPEMSYSSHYIVYPVAVVQVAPSTVLNRKQMENLAPDPATKGAVPVSNMHQSKGTEPKRKTILKHERLASKTIKKNPNFGLQYQSKIENTIQQTIRKNNNHQKIVQEISKTVWQNKNSASAKTPKGNLLNSRGPVNNLKIGSMNPKFTPGKASTLPHTSTRTVPHQSNAGVTAKKGNANKRLPNRESSHEEEHKKQSPAACGKLSNITAIHGKGLQQKELPKIAENSQDDIQKYLQLIELKFLRTFSLPEEQKVGAYNVLAQEISDMLQVLASDNAQEKQLKIVESLERLTNIPSKTSSQEIVPQCKRNFKCASNTVINSMSVSMKTLATTSMEVNKQIVAQTSRSTVCSESISFMDSLSAIMSKQSQLFPALSRTNSENSNKPVSILKTSASGKIYSPKTVRFGPQDPKILKSDISISYSSDDDDNYTTIHEEDLIGFISEDDVTAISVECSWSMDLKTSITYAFVEHLVTVTNSISIFVEVSILNRDTFLLNYSLIESYDTGFLEPIDFDIRIRNFDMFCSESNTKSSSNISCTTSPGNSKYVLLDTSNTNSGTESSNYMPIETKSSPNVIEFLDILANFSFETIPYRDEIFYKTIISCTHTEYEASMTCSIMFFHSIELLVPKDIQQLVPKLGVQSKQLRKLAENSGFATFPRLMSVRPLRLRRRVFLERCDNLYDMRDGNCLSLLNLSSTRSLELRSAVANVNNQTMLVNVHIRKNQLKDKSHLEEPQMHHMIQDASFQENTVEVNQHRNNYKLILIFLYITIFSTIIFCTFLNNYKCE